MARAYATSANGGLRIDGALTGNRPRAIVAVGDKHSTEVRCGGAHVHCNRMEKRRVLRPDTAAAVSAILQRVVEEGTGTAAALPDRPVAGKTGTTENYGDAWFVGYTPQLVTAARAGYPKGLRPMMRESPGGPVVGGTSPAQIWKAFMQPALKLLGASPESFPSPPYLSAAAKRVTYRDGKIELDNGRCRDVSLLVYFAGRGPGSTANCKVNEVEVPNVI